MYRQIVIKPGLFGQALQQEFKKTHGGKLDWESLAKVKDIKQQMKINQIYESNVHHLKTFKKAFIKDVTANQKYQYDQKSDSFTRKNQYPQITNFKSLAAYVQKDSGGLLIAQEILYYTYSQVAKDLDKAISQGRFKKINVANKSKKDFYIFNNITEELYNIKQDKHQYFGQDYFLKMCKDNYKDFSLLRSDELILGEGNGMQISHQKFNDWVPNYMDLKDLWRKKNEEKHKQKN